MVAATFFAVQKKNKNCVLLDLLLFVIKASKKSQNVFSNLQHICFLFLNDAFLAGLLIKNIYFKNFLVIQVNITRKNKKKKLNSV